MSAVPPQVDPDSLRAALRVVFTGREYRWTEPSSTWTWLMARWQLLLDWLESLRVVYPVRYYVVLGALTLVLVTIVAHLTWVLWRSLRPVDQAPAPAQAAPPPRDAAWHLAEALRLGAAGRFVEALAHRFLAVVLDLDRRRVVQFHPSKTPAEYATEARLDETGRSELAELVASLYRHLFGGAPCDAEQWQRFDARANGLRLYAATR